MRGLTRRLRREWWGCRPEGVVLSFEAKESTKESTRHGDYVKKASTAHFAGGARNVARNGVGQLSPTPVRAPVLAFFRRQNGRAFFPPLPIAALLPHSWRWADSTNASWDITLQLGWSRRRGKQACFFPTTVGTMPTQSAPLGMFRCKLNIFVMQKASVGSSPHWPFGQAGGPVARRRPSLFNWRETTPDSRAARPVAERR